MKEKFHTIEIKMIELFHFLIEGENKLWTAAFILYCCFHTFFENLLSKCFVEPFLSTFQDTFTIGLLFVFITLFIFIYLYKKIKYLRNRSENEYIVIRPIYPLVLFLFVYFYYRCLPTDNRVWCFMGIWSNNYICYSDAIILVCIAIMISKIYVQKKVEEPKKDNAFNIDNPITTYDEDRLGRKPFAEILARKIFDTETTEGAFTVGIVAPWGYGKTSFINIMKNIFVERGAIVINFTPWLYGEGNNLTKAFFVELSKYLKIYNHSIYEKLIPYAELLESVEIPYMKVMSNILENNNKKNLDTLKNDLEKALQKIDRPIIVIIDDLDRLGAKDIIEVMKIIRNSANFSNIRFIAAYDRSYVTNAIKNLTSSENYLEKIFQIEYVLPQFDMQILSNYLKEKLSFVQENEELDSTISNTLFAIEELKNLRDIKRFINMFRVVYDKLHGEIILLDLMNLIILKQKYNDVYTFFVKNYEYILTNTGESLILYNKDKDKDEKLVYINKLFSFHNKIDLEKDWNIYFKDKYNQEQKDSILSLIKRLFPLSYSYNKNGINNPWSIKRYFHDILLDEDYSENEFHKIWIKDENLIKDDINAIPLIKINSFIKMLANNKPNNKEEYIKKVKAILYCGEKTYKDFYQFDDVLEVINNVIDFTEEEHKAFIENILNEKSTSNFTIRFLAYSAYREKPINGLSSDANQRIRLEIFKNMAKNNTSLDEIYNALKYTNEYNVIKDGGLYKEVRHPEAYKTFIEYAKRNPINVISYFIIDKVIENKRYFGISDIIKEIWGGWDAYEEFLKNIENHNAEKEEYLEFFSLFKYNTYKYISFDFKHIHIKKNNI